MRQSPSRHDHPDGLHRAIAESIELVVVSRAGFRAAARFADQQGLALRSGDAWHLAIAAAHGATLHRLDRRPAGPRPGVPTHLLA